jgi:large subunit ribosomal protein L23
MKLPILKKKTKKEEKREEMKKEKTEKILKRKKKLSFEKINKILYFPHVSEKSTKLSSENKYVFKVYPQANKTEIKKAIESLYNVDVVSVRTMRMPSKTRRRGYVIGFKKGYKKAIVTIKKGQEISI